MRRSHRVALKPAPEQESLFGQHAGYARFAYNWALAEFKAGLEANEWTSERTFERTLRPRWNRVKGMIAPWGTVLSQNAAEYAITDFGQAAESWGRVPAEGKGWATSWSACGLPAVQTPEA